MLDLLVDKKILVGVCGSIAAYKAVDFVRELGRLGATVTVVMTESARQFVTPLTFAALSGQRVHGTMFAAEDAEQIPHIALGRSHDLLLIAPATAQTISRLSQGQADDLLTALVLAAQCPVLVCPAMNSAMFLHPATQHNLRQLLSYGYQVVEPDTGTMACGDDGPGRLAAWPQVETQVKKALQRQDLAGKKVLITAGPTEEPLDPVRFLSNRSSGKMGYALAAIAYQRGAEVLLVSGPTHLAVPPGVLCVDVRTAQEMEVAVAEHFASMDIVVKCAAVSDFRPATCAPQKLKKARGNLSLELRSNPDILQGLGHKKQEQFLVGFAAESERHLAEGKRKLAAKNLDMMVVNDISGPQTGFGVATNAVTLLHANGECHEIPLATKEEIAMVIFDQIVANRKGPSHEV